jgi:hypothetical protein
MRYAADNWTISGQKISMQLLRLLKPRQLDALRTQANLAIRTHLGGILTAAF